jgi:Asp/Glu/hydantoin racemase
MSIKAIKELARLCASEGYAPEVIGLGEAALAEAEALSRAATIIAKATEEGWPTTPIGSLNLQHSFELLVTIAKEGE